MSPSGLYVAQGDDPLTSEQECSLVGKMSQWVRAASWPGARGATRQAFEEAPRYKPQFKRADYGISRWATP